MRISVSAIILFLWLLAQILFPVASANGRSRRVPEVLCVDGEGGQASAR